MLVLIRNDNFYFVGTTTDALQFSSRSSYYQKIVSDAGVSYTILASRCSSEFNFYWKYGVIGLFLRLTDDYDKVSQWRSVRNYILKQKKN